MKKKLAFPLSICLCVVLVFFSCQNVGSETGESTPGVTDTEIKIGSFGPLTGPAALWGSVVKGMDAYFRMINEEGGVNGRQIKFIFKDDEYNPS